MRACRHFANIAGLCAAKRTPMIETNPILAQITDLKARVKALRGFL
jgi:hypothetical protein